MKKITTLLIAGFSAAFLIVLVFALTNSPVVAKEKPETAERPTILQPTIPGTFLTGPNEGEPLTIALAFIHENRAELQLSEAEVSGLAVKDSYLSRKTGVTHIYLVQTHDGIEVYNAILNVNIGRDGSVINVGNRTVPNLTDAIEETDIQLSAVNAVEKAAKHLQIPLSQTPIVDEIIGGVARKVIINSNGVSIPVQLIYQPLPDGRVRLAWELTIYELSGENWQQIRIDAANGNILSQNNLMIYDNWGEGYETGLTNGNKNYQLGASAVPSSYLVYAIPVESPHFASPPPPADARTVELSPWLDAPTASPLGWHATTTTSWTNTQGNNVDTHKDAIRYDCGASLECDPPLDLTMEPTTPDNLNAALVNLFYWNNVVHDVTYEHGFDEVAGNFQSDNFGLGGLGNDRLNANAQVLGSCGGGFGVPPDGSQPVMNMYTCGMASPARDGALDNGVIAHEYGHGVSNRLTGGPSNVSCLSNAEQMGEGWADWLGLMMTIEPGDAGTDLRTLGTWLFGQGPNGPGIRQYPYTTDFNANPHTYDDLITTVTSHDVGEIWATMVWDMVWALIDKHGYNPNFYADWSTGGNNLAFQLVLDGMKLQPCSPGFVDGRDAILLADIALTGGQNQCLIWQAFANRGLGYSADQGSSSSVFDGVEAFDLPQFCSLLNAQPTSLEICAGDAAEYQVTVGNGFTPNVDLTLAGNPPGTTAAFSSNPVTAVPTTVTLTVGNTGSLPSSSYNIVVTATDGVAATSSQTVSLAVYDAVPAMVNLTSPPNNITNVEINPLFEWTTPLLATSYFFELDDAPDFASPIHTAAIENFTYTLPITLDYETVYYWRVTAENICGAGPTSNVSSFVTVAEDIGLLVRDLDLIEETVAPGEIATRTVTISNTGTMPFNFTAEADAIWAEVAPSSGTLPPSQSLPLSVVLNSNQTAGTGTYTASLTFNGNFGNDPAPVSLILHVVSEENAIYMPGVFNAGSTASASPIAHPWFLLPIIGATFVVGARKVKFKNGDNKTNTEKTRPTGRGNW